MSVEFQPDLLIILTFFTPESAKTSQYSVGILTTTQFTVFLNFLIGNVEYF